jgi:hypothetical protein
MANFGMCENPECSLFYEKASLPVLRDIMKVLNARRKKMSKEEQEALNFPPNEEPRLALYRHFFQFRAKSCSGKTNNGEDCGQRLHLVAQPTKDAKFEELLNIGNELQGWKGAF